MKQPAIMTAGTVLCISWLACQALPSAALPDWSQPKWKYAAAPHQDWFKATMPEEHVYLTAFTQQRVNPSKDLLTILMPILPSTAELGYVLNQMRTFSRFADMGSIREYLIITPQKHLLGMETFFHEQLPQLVPDIAATTFRIVTDGDCIPEANPEFQYYRDPAEYWWNGWLVSACEPVLYLPHGTWGTVPFMLMCQLWQGAGSSIFGSLHALEMGIGLRKTWFSRPQTFIDGMWVCSKPCSRMLSGEAPAKQPRP